MPLRDLRKSRDISLRDLEELTSVNRAVWSQIERGRLLPQPRHLAALAQVFDVPESAFALRIQLVVEVPSA